MYWVSQWIVKSKQNNVIVKKDCLLFKIFVRVHVSSAYPKRAFAERVSHRLYDAHLCSDATNSCAQNATLAYSIDATDQETTRPVRQTKGMRRLRKLLDGRK